MNPKARLRKQADDLWKQACVKKWGIQCSYCGLQAIQVHHFLRKSKYGHIRYLIDNGVPCCKGCHLGADDPIMIDVIKDLRGKIWYNKLKKKALDRPSGSYINIGWYKGQIKYLQEHFNKV